jgi:thioredoxin reductase (NADPH)
LDLYEVRIRTDEITAIEGEEKGKVLKAFQLGSERIPTEICFVSMGMLVHNELAKQFGAKVDERGFVKADDNGFIIDYLIFPFASIIL